MSEEKKTEEVQEINEITIDGRDPQGRVKLKKYLKEHLALVYNKIQEYGNQKCTLKFANLDVLENNSVSKKLLFEILDLAIKKEMRIEKQELFNEYKEAKEKFIEESKTSPYRKDIAEKYSTMEEKREQFIASFCSVIQTTPTQETPTQGKKPSRIKM